MAEEELKQEEKPETAEEVLPDAAEQPAEDAAEAETGKLSFKDKKKQSAELKKLQTRAEEAEKSAEEYKDRYTRMCAEFENYKRRTSREMDSRYEDAKADVWKNILPVVDNFERALSQEKTENDPFREGVELIYRQFTEAMKAAGVTEIEALNAEFNPELHNAVMHVDDETVGANTVTEVFVKGYRIGEKVLRYSMVKVAN